MHAYGISVVTVYYAYTGNQMDLSGAIRNEGKDRVRINFQPRKREPLLLEYLRSLKVSERTVVQRI